jgi:hypothetical protein
MFSVRHQYLMILKTYVFIIVFNSVTQREKKNKKNNFIQSKDEA